jgi:hypothetical protein
LVHEWSPPSTPSHSHWYLQQRLQWAVPNLSASNRPPLWASPVGAPAVRSVQSRSISFTISQRQRPDGSARAHCETSAAAVGACAAASAAPCAVRSGPTNPGSFDSCDKCLRNNQRKARRAGIGIAPLTPARRPTPNPYPRSPMRAHLTRAGPIAESAAHSPAAVARGASVQRSVKGLTPTAMLRRT